MDQVAALRAFVRIVETGSFTQAAASLETPKPTVTKLVQQLEAHLRTKLPSRTTRRLAEVHPLAAVLLRRKIVDAALARARTQAYDRVVLDLLAAEQLAVQVEDWQDFPTQDSYREAVARQHRAKTSFWARMNAAGLSWQR